MSIRDAPQVEHLGAPEVSKAPVGVNEALPNNQKISPLALGRGGWTRYAVLGRYEDSLAHSDVDFQLKSSNLNSPLLPFQAWWN